VSSSGAVSDDGRLADLQTLTDTKLTSLDLDNLLEELLARVRDILSVDTAAVLLFERGTDGLVARAACGIEDEVRQGVRVPVGIGFAAMSLGPPEAVARDIMRHVIGDYVPQDDIALVVMRRSASPVETTP
jgi:hypothetical protein